MSKIIIIAVGGIVAGVAVALAMFVFVLGGGKSTTEAAVASPTPVHVEGKLGPHITLQDRIFNLQGGGGTQTYVKLQTVIEFETTSKEWAKVLHGCTAVLGTSAPMAASTPLFAVGDTLDREGATVDPCVAAEAKLQEEFAREIGTGQHLIEDAVLSVVSKHTAAEISTPAGKDSLKQEIKDAIGKLIPEPKVTRVLFTNFITQ